MIWPATAIQRSWIRSIMFLRLAVSIADGLAAAKSELRSRGPPAAGAANSSADRHGTLLQAAGSSLRVNKALQPCPRTFLPERASPFLDRCKNSPGAKHQRQPEPGDGIDEMIV